jgi:hypothetical protein
MQMTIFIPNVIVITNVYMHTLTLYPRRGAEASQIFLRVAMFYQNYLAMSNTANVTGGKPVAV